MSIQNFNPHSRRHRGFTLIELMIAMIIGLLMIGGLIQIFLGNRAAYRVMEGANFMQENMRFAVDRIAMSLREADHWGTVQRSDIAGSNTSATVCTAAWARNLSLGVVAYDGISTTVPSALTGCSSMAANYQGYTDIIMIRYAGPDVIPPGATLTSGQYYVRTGTGVRGWLYAGPSASTATVSGNPPVQYLNMQYNAEMFWVRKCSDPGADNNCGNADDGDTPISIPTLMRSFLAADGTWTSEAVAEGMEQLQLEYQVMNRGWMNATSVNSYTVPSGSPWDYMTGARITGLMRSGQRDPSFPADTRTFNLSGDTAGYTIPVSPQNAQVFMHQQYEASVVMRNRVRPAPSI